MNVPEEVKAIDPVAGNTHVTPKGPPVIEPVVIVFVVALQAVVPLNVKSFMLKVPPAADAPNPYNLKVIALLTF